MAQSILNNLDDRGDFRGKTNDNFTELYGRSVAVPADYIVNTTGATITATAKPDSGLLDFSGSDAYTVIQSAIDALTPAGAPGSGGGSIYLNRGTYTLTDELVVSGWEGIEFALPQASIRITGSGYSTKLVQNTAAKNAIVVKNNCTVFITDMWIVTGSSSYSAILFDDTGADTVQSVHVGELDRLMLYGQSTTRPTLHLKNFFNINVPSIVVYGLANTAIKLEGTSSVGNFGNSTFGHLKILAGEGASDCALHLIGTQDSRPMNLCTFDLVEAGGQGIIGVHLENAQLNTFKMIVIEGMPTPVKITAASAAKAVRNNYFLSGLIEPREIGRVGLVLGEHTGGNQFNLIITSLGDDPSGDAAMTLVDDDNTVNPANTYDLTLDAGFTPTTKITVASDHTMVKYREASTGATTMYVPPISASDSSSKVATTAAATLKAYRAMDQMQQLFSALGSTIKLQTFDVILAGSQTPSTLTDGQLRLMPMLVKDVVTYTGIKWIQRTQGSYTADNENRVGLYSYDNAGIITLVASSTDDGNIWKATGNSLATKAFSSTYLAVPGVYFIGLLFNNSAVPTPPTVAGQAFGNAVYGSLDFTNSAGMSLVLSSQSTLPSSVTLSSTTAASNTCWIALY